MDILKRPPKTPFAAEPSKLLVKYANLFLAAPPGQILDVACGYGRNAIYLASIGLDITCIDHNSELLTHIDKIESCKYNSSKNFGHLSTTKMDLKARQWPFAQETISGLIIVHFYPHNILDLLLNSIKIGGFFLMETIDGRGGNFLELPQQGKTMEKLMRSFTIIYSKERKVGPAGSNAATLKVVAKKAQACPLS